MSDNVFKFPVHLSGPFNKTVFVAAPVVVEAGSTFASAFKEAASEVKMTVESYAAHNQIRDLEAGINPEGATHEIVNDGRGRYNLNRVGFVN
jgi:hypothetical protein